NKAHRATRIAIVMYATSATTRGRSAGVALKPIAPLLAPAQVIASSDTGLEYRVERMLGEGGFGQVFLATRLGRSGAVPGAAAVKVSGRIDGWLREAYFGQVLDGHPPPIPLFDPFP